MLACFGSAYAQLDTTDLKTQITSNFPDNTAGFITPARLRAVAFDLMRSNANLLERNEFSEPLQVNDTIKSEVGFFTWNGSGWTEVGNLADTAVWARSGGFILPLEYSDKLSIDTARVGGLLYPNDATTNIGTSSVPFDTVFADVFQATPGSGCECIKSASLSILSADVLTLNSIPKTIVFAPGAGYAIQVISASLKLDFNSVAYATNTRLELLASGAAHYQITFNNSVLSSGSDTWNHVSAPSVSGTNIIENADLQVTVDTGDPTAGDSDITVYVLYQIIEL